MSGLGAQHDRINGASLRGPKGPLFHRLPRWRGAKHGRGRLHPSAQRPRAGDPGLCSVYIFGTQPRAAVLHMSFWLKVAFVRAALFWALPVTIFIDRFAAFAYTSQGTTEERLRRGRTRKGQHSCSLWATVGSTVTAASGGLKHWEKLSFRAEHLPPPPECGEEVCLAAEGREQLAISKWQLAKLARIQPSALSPNIESKRH